MRAAYSFKLILLNLITVDPDAKYKCSKSLLYVTFSTPLSGMHFRVVRYCFVCGLWPRFENYLVALAEKPGI
jgi:hypothetical protein